MSCKAALDSVLIINNAALGPDRQGVPFRYLACCSASPFCAEKERQINAWKQKDT